MKRELLALGVTACIVVSLVAFAQPTAAVLTTVDGPDQVEKPGSMTFTTAVEIREDERIPVEAFELVIATADGETVTVTFAPDGSVRSIDPARGVVGAGEIKINRLRKSLEVTALEGSAAYGYGDRSATDERTGERRDYGYGYGFGYGYGADASSFAFDVEVDSTAFKHGTYTIQLRVDTGDGTASFASEEKQFDVRPPGHTPGDRPDDGDGDDGDRDDDRHDRWDRDDRRDVLRGWLVTVLGGWWDDIHDRHDRWDDRRDGDRDRARHPWKGHVHWLDPWFDRSGPGDRP